MERHADEQEALRAKLAAEAKKEAVAKAEAKIYEMGRLNDPTDFWKGNLFKNEQISIHYILVELLAFEICPYIFELRHCGYF